jgi:hypothetical protein
MTQRIKFTEAEIKALSESPTALKALAYWHEVQATIGEASGFSCTANDERSQQLLAESRRLYNRYDNGDDPGFTE